MSRVIFLNKELLHILENRREFFMSIPSHEEILGAT